MLKGERAHESCTGGGRVAGTGEVGVLVPVLERLADAGVLLGGVGELGPGGEVGGEPGQGSFAAPDGREALEDRIRLTRANS